MERAIAAESRLEEALSKEAALLERALAAERAAADAATGTFSGTRDEQLEAERAAKRAAEAEASENRLWRRHLERKLDEVRAGLCWAVTLVWLGG